VRLPSFIVPLTVCAATLVAAPAALADTSQSSNWAGYAVHRGGTSFSRVLGKWQQPLATCTSNQPTYSAIWVGLGGFSPSSPALEQIGTELDCSASGKVESSAWYEFVPAASHTIRLSVRPGDQVSAAVNVTGSRVVLTLTNLTRHRTFSKTLHGRVDVSSAEWIVEAPSDCFSDGTCQTLPLADFGSANFNLASARSMTGHNGAVSDRAWNTTRIDLAPGGRRFVGFQAAGAGTAIASSLGAGGNTFSVTYRGAASGTQAAATRQLRRDGHLVHPARG
jgi:hypothetical protein